MAILIILIWNLVFKCFERILVLNNGFQKGKLDISNRSKQFKGFKGIIINLETILSIIDFGKVFGFEIKLELKTSTYMVILEMNLFDLNFVDLEIWIIF